MADTKPAAEEVPRVEEEAKPAAAAAAAVATDAQAGAQAAEGDALTMSEKTAKAKEIVTQQVEEAKSAMDKVKSLFGK